MYLTPLLHRISLCPMQQILLWINTVTIGTQFCYFWVPSQSLWVPSQSLCPGCHVCAETGINCVLLCKRAQFLPRGGTRVTSNCNCTTVYVLLSCMLGMSVNCKCPSEIFCAREGPQESYRQALWASAAKQRTHGLTAPSPYIISIVKRCF